MIMTARCLHKEMYVILRLFSLADEGIIRCGIWKMKLEKCKFEKTYNFSTVSIINHQTVYQGKS